MRWDAESKRAKVGPDSVGSRISSEALVFGGDILTTSDIAVAAGSASLGTHVQNVSKLSSEMVEITRAEIKKMLEEALDAMRISPEPISAYLVGGGAFLAPDRLQGIIRVVKLPHADVANAIGAAIAQVRVALCQKELRRLTDFTMIDIRDRRYCERCLQFLGGRGAGRRPE